MCSKNKLNSSVFLFLTVVIKIRLANLIKTQALVNDNSKLQVQKYRIS